MKIIVTGATGFVGSHLVRHFSELGHEVVAMGRQAQAPSSLLLFASWLQLDLEDDKYPILDADVIVHAAGMTADRGSYEAFVRSNVDPTLKLYTQFKGKHFVFISSSSIYPFINRPLKEKDGMPSEGLSNYGRSKLEAEDILIKNQRPDCKLTILRPRSIYGTNDRVLLPKILKLYKKKILLIGSMNIEVSMTHISNLIKAVDASIKNQRTELGIFNVADNQTYSLRTVIICLIEKLTGKELQTLRLPLFFISCLTKMTRALRIPFALSPQSLDYLSKSCIIDATKIKSDLNVEFNATFYEELDAMVDWINKVGLSKVKSADPKLPWLGL